MVPIMKPSPPHSLHPIPFLQHLPPSPPLSLCHLIIVLRHIGILFVSPVPSSFLLFFGTSSSYPFVSYRSSPFSSIIFFLVLFISLSLVLTSVVVHFSSSFCNDNN